uniref:Uncharacterized protein n=1 Tax=Panagrolaimus sp. ES5 TaxID=591445 RepID=A0AC34FEP2_9BILA
MVSNSFVESNPEFKWCPNQNNGCEKAVKTESSSKVEEITCTCESNTFLSASIPNRDQTHIPRPEFKFYKFHETMLKKEYKLLRDLDDVKNKNVNSLKTALKQLHDFRHKFYHFYVFSYFLDRSQNYGTFEDRMKQMEELLEKASKMIDFPEHSDKSYYTEEQLKASY